MHIEAAPVSLWLRSDLDEQDLAGLNKPTTVIRICKQGDDLTGTTIGGSKRHPLHPIHYELACGKTDIPTLDLSVYGTPMRINDDDVILGTNDDLFPFAYAADLTAYGQFEQQLPIPVGQKRKKVLHVYVYVIFNRMSVTLDAIFAVDGHEIKGLERTSSSDVLKDEGMAIMWRTHNKIDMKRVHLWQVARPELLGLDTAQLPPSAQKTRTTGKPCPQALKRGRKRKRYAGAPPDIVEADTTASFDDEQSHPSSIEL
jgi:hypothetical protein